MIDAIRDTTVLLSEMMRNVLFDEDEMNAAWASGPPCDSYSAVRRTVICGNQLKFQRES